MWKTADLMRGLGDSAAARILTVTDNFTVTDNLTVTDNRTFTVANNRTFTVANIMPAKKSAPKSTARNAKNSAAKRVKPKPDTRRFSAPVVDGFERAPSRSMLRAIGFDDGDFKRPQIGVASTWSGVTPCNMHINRLAEQAAAGADAARAKAVVFNTITVSTAALMSTSSACSRPSARARSAKSAPRN